MQSCIYEDMKACEGDFYGNIYISNDWKNAPEADPEGMAYFLFPENGKAYWRFDIPGRTGGKIKIPTGSYKFIMFNDDAVNVIELNDTNFDSISLSTPEGPLFYGCDNIKDYPESVISLNQVTLLNPDKMWCYSIDEINVRMPSKEQIINTAPIPVTATYHVEVNNVSNLNGVKCVSGAMSGMAKSINLHNRELSSSAVIHPCNLAKSEVNQITGKFQTFGRCSSENISNMLFLFIWLSDGRRYVYNYDVTEIIKGADDPMDVWIVIDNLQLPESDPIGGDFNVSVDGWNTIYINYSDATGKS